jgi:hypothetical protein
VAEKNLRQQLLDTSRSILDEVGPSALSMREVARRTGCTHQAPYHYFPNREAIIAAVVLEGFQKLQQYLHQAKTTDPSSTGSADAYVRFALENPGVFRVMFRTDMYNPEHFPEIRAAGDAAFHELLTLVQEIEPDPAKHQETAAALWSHVHGLASLLLDGAFGQDYSSTAEKLQFAHRINSLIQCPPLT